MVSGKSVRPVVMILDGNSRLTLQLAEELSRDLRAIVVGVGPEMECHLLRSRYCDVKEIAPFPREGAYREAVLRLIRKHRPNAVLTVNHDSVVTLDAMRDLVPEGVDLCLPHSSVLQAALDKGKTLAAAKRVEIQVPEDYTDRIHGLDSSSRDPKDLLEQLSFPVFLKAARETRGHVAAKVNSSSRFWPVYDGLREQSKQRAMDSPVLVQEYVNADSCNYCYGFLFVDGDPRLSFGHQKIRSVLREFGTAARVRVFRDDRLRAMSEKLLRELGLENGVALVEYKKRHDGAYVLMEVNPRFWGAYPLASKSGYHFASHMVAGSMGLRIESPTTEPKGDLWFPFREARYLRGNRKEGPFLKSMIGAGWPPCRWDLNVRDLGSVVALWLAAAPVEEALAPRERRELTHERAPLG